MYYQGNYELSDKIQLNGGLRLTNWANLGPKTYYTFDENYEVQDTLWRGQGVYNNYFRADPRLSVDYKLDETAQFKLSYGIYHQYLQLISNSVSPFSTLEIWLPASPNIKPQASTQIALDFSKYIEKYKLEFAASTYYKWSKNQIGYDGHATTYINSFLEGELRFGTAQSYGIELFFKKKFGRLDASLNYTYARVRKRINGINNGLVFNAFQDRPHDFSLVLAYQWTRRVQCSAYWTSYSGSPFTSPVGFFEFNEQTVPLYGGRHNDRLPSYHRLDLGIQFILNKNPDSQYQHSVNFSIYNALAHKNVYAIKFNKLKSETLMPPVPTNTLAESTLSPSQIDLIRFFPSLTYKFKL